MNDPIPAPHDTIFGNLPADKSAETVATLLRGQEFELQRIVSFGQASAEGFWYEQPEAEWVLLLAGSAGLLFEGEAEPHGLSPGDYILIPAFRRHRVAWTDAQVPTIWLVLLHRPG